jgi:hypothetical protein
MWREFPDHPAVNLQKRCEISRFWSGFLRQPKHNSQHSRRIPTFRLKNGSCSLSVFKLINRREGKVFLTSGAISCCVVKTLRDSNHRK